MYVLGVSALYHDSAAALIQDGKIIAAAQEERFTRVKHDASIPINAIRYCISSANVLAEQLDAIVFYDNPFLTLNRFISNLQYVKNDCDDLLKLSLEPLLLKKIWVEKFIRKELGSLGKQDVLFFTRHHISHAASAFYPSPFKKAAIITIDGVGEWTTTSIGMGDGNKIELYKEIRYPNSLGLLYSAFTYFCGFKVNSGDYKLMGLAPYGNPCYYKLIKDKLIDIKSDGSYRLNLDYFDFQNGRSMTNDKFASLFGGEPRRPESQITKREMDMAASVQKVIEEVIVLLANHTKQIVGDDVKHLVMAGGVALNCVSNGKLQRKKIFDDIWIQPAAGDAGGALGAALYYYYYKSGKSRISDEVHDVQYGSYLGPNYNDEDIEKFLNENNYAYKRWDEDDIFQEIAKLIDNQMVIGLFEGRMEYGPRALGNRSIIADPRSPYMQSKLNMKIKYRESFRPFAPAVLEERKDLYFENAIKSPYMLMCMEVRKEIQKDFELNRILNENEDNMLSAINTVRSDIPAVTHVDYSARVQTVTEESNPFFYKILKSFLERTGCSTVINTSFNVRGEPIVCSPIDAYKCFMRTEMDVLVMGHCILRKEEQPIFEDNEDWRGQYALD